MTSSGLFMAQQGGSSSSGGGGAEQLDYTANTDFNREAVFASGA